jgi:uncharacterized membrane protein (DUF373 family)
MRAERRASGVDPATGVAAAFRRHIGRRVTPDRHVDRRARPRRRVGMRLRLPEDIDEGLSKIEGAIYVVVAALLLTAAGFTLVGTIVDVFEGSKSRPIADTGVFLLDRILLLFIFAELLYSLRVVHINGVILVEPFVFIGLIAVLRKVLVLTAEFVADGDAVRDFVLQIGALSLLTVVLVLSIWVLRRSAVPEPGPTGSTGPP